MVVWSAEESATFTGLNERIVAGDVKPSDMDKVWSGDEPTIRKIGGAPERITDAIRPRGAHHCYLELHIEQGGVSNASAPLGVVEGIVSIDATRHRDLANHAGTTPIARTRSWRPPTSRSACAIVTSNRPTGGYVGRWTDAKLAP